MTLNFSISPQFSNFHTNTVPRQLNWMILNFPKRVFRLSGLQALLIPAPPSGLVLPTSQSLFLKFYLPSIQDSLRGPLLPEASTGKHISPDVLRAQSHLHCLCPKPHGPVLVLDILLIGSPLNCTWHTFLISREEKSRLGIQIESNGKKNLLNTSFNLVSIIWQAP